jgi:hypothetical protein
MPKTLLEQEMPVVRLSAGAEEPLAASHETTPIAVTERREAERAISDWEEERRRLGRELALMTLNASEMVSEKWSHRFIIAVDPTVEYCSLLFYGAKFAALMGLPEKPNHSIPMVEQLPSRYAPVFTKGCTDATLLGTPVRMQGAVDREDGRQELYRAAFIPLAVTPNRQQRLAFGAFNCRVVEGGA